MTDTKVVLAVVLLLGAFALGGLGGTIWLIHGGSPAEAVAITAGLTGTALGSLGTLLASTRSGTVAQPVEVTNSPQNAVPVEPGVGA